MDSFNLLNGLTPWWWLAIAFVLGAVEMATGTYVLMWLGLAALALAGVLALGVDLALSGQIALFALFSVVFTFGGRALFNRFGDGATADNTTLNQRGQQYVGRRVKVLECVDGLGAIEIEGMRWRAQWQDGNCSKAGDMVKITKAQGMTLYVSSAAS